MRVESVYSITPEMLGLTWSRLFRKAAARSILYFLVAVLLASLFTGRCPMSLSAAVVGSLLDFVLTFTVRLHAPTRLRVTDDFIKEVDGPVIRKDEIVALTELNDREPNGIEIVGRRRVSWLPKYRIFVPAALLELSELRQRLYGWKQTL